MLWIPITAAGIINGIGHWWGYRNFEAPDASTNMSPWGIMIGGEELHNNHHTYPTSAKFSVKPYEFDIGWVYIRALEMMGLAKVRKTPPKLKLGSIKPGGRRQDARGDHRQPLRGDGQVRTRPAPRHAASKLPRLKAEGAAERAKLENMQLAKRWLHRDDDKIPHAVKAQVAAALRAQPGAGQAGGDARGTALSSGPAPTCRPSSSWPICRPGARRPRTAASPRCRSSR